MMNRAVFATGIAVLCSICVDGLDTDQVSQEIADPARGRDIWFNNTYGGQKFFWFLQNHPDPARRVTVGFPNVINTPRAIRFNVWGVVNDPDCVANPAGGPDICPDPTATGVIGMRKFPAPGGGATMYGVSCASCHAGFDPLHPPANPNDPSWDNIHPTIGNQYQKIGAMFAVNLPPTDPRRLIFAAWPDGTVDTQLLFNDNIQNPGVVTAFWEWRDRPRFDVGMDEPKMRNGQGGEDDIGPDLAAVRVYTNIGACFFECSQPALATGRPVDIAACKASCADFPPHQDLVDLGSFLGSVKAPQYPAHEIGELSGVGRMVFNKECRSCHDNTGGKQHVLSNDEVNPIVADPFNATNTCRARTTMWERGRLWEQFSSELYKQRIEAGNRGYRSMPLGGIWTTSPFLHNQSIGVWAPANATPEQRAEAYRTSMWELLSANRVPKVNRIPVAVGPFPMGTPTTIVFSRDPLTGQVLCDDVVENRGHYYGSQLSTFEKTALIYWLQYQ